MLKRRARSGILVVATLLAGCGGRTGDEAHGDAGVVADGGVDASIGPDAAIDDAACRAAVHALGMVTTNKYCTAMVRLSSIDHTILGWTIACGGLKVATEPDARAAFAAQLPPFTMVDSYRRVGPTGGTNDFVFYQSPGDFGGLGVVSLATSALVFSGELSWSATGKILYPTTFRSAAEIPTVCAPTTLPDVSTVSLGGLPDANEVNAVVAAVSKSALPRALSGAHAMIHTLVVPFPSTAPPAWARRTTSGSSRSIRCSSTDARW